MKYVLFSVLYACLFGPSSFSAQQPTIQKLLTCSVSAGAQALEIVSQGESIYAVEIDLDGGHSKLFPITASAWQATSMYWTGPKLGRTHLFKREVKGDDGVVNKYWYVNSTIFEGFCH